MKKEKLLNKIVKGNFNNNLEKVLSKKDFPIEVKNELLTMFYKIETGYDDYYTIKREAFDKKDYIENLISIIDKNCKKILFINKEDTSEEKTTTNKNEIKCLPIDIKILEALSNIQKNEVIVKDVDEDIAKSLSNFLNKGDTINKLEPLRDFNGFSWNVITKDIEDIEYNLMFQNLIFLVGNEFINKWINNSDSTIDYFSLLKDEIEQKYGKTIQNKIITDLIKLSVWKEAALDNRFKKKMESKKEDLEEEFYELENREMYLAKISKLKKKKEKEIKNLDKIINSKKLLQNEYNKRNESLHIEKKIFSTRVLKEKIKKERETLLKEINEYNQLMTPKIFLKKKHEIEENLKYIDVYEDIELEKEIKETIISLQKEIIKCIYNDAEKTIDKQQLINILYKLRYYNLIPIDETQFIYQINKLSKDLDKLAKSLTNKAIEMKLIIKITDDDNINKEILEKILVSKIIKLEDINIKITNEKNNIYLTIYDEETQENKVKLENISKQNIKIKLNKKTNLFI